MYLVIHWAVPVLHPHQHYYQSFCFSHSIRDVVVFHDFNIHFPNLTFFLMDHGFSSMSKNFLPTPRS